MRKLVIPLVVAPLTVAVALWLMTGFNRGPQRLGDGSETSAPATPGVVASESSRSAPGEVPAQPGQSANAADVQARDGALLHGRITDEAGRALSRAKVLVLPASRDLADDFERARSLKQRILGKEARDARIVIASATANGAGEYAIPLTSIPAGDYDVLAREPSHAPRRQRWSWVPETTELNFRLAPGETISGVVLDPEGKPVAGAVVEAAPEGGGPFFFGGGGDVVSDRDDSDSEGKFALSVAPGTYRVSGSATGFSRQSENDVDSGTQDLEVLLEYAGQIRGRVVDGGGGAVAGARIALYRGEDSRFDGGRGGRGGPGGFGGPGGPGGGGAPGGAWRFLRLIRNPNARAVSDPDGTFAFSDLSEGSYVLLAESAGFVPADAAAEIKDLETAAEVDLKLAPGKVLSGRVVNAAGEAVGGAFVAVGEDRGRDEGGRRDRRRGGGREEGGGRGPDQEEAKEDGAGGSPAPAPTEKSSRPNPLTLFRALSAAETDADGRFRIDSLPGGVYSVGIEAQDYVPHRQDGIELGIAGAEEERRIDVVLDPGLRLEGSVVSSLDAKPISGARLRLQIEDDDRREVVTDGEGRYSVGGLYPGAIDEVTVGAKGFSLLFLKGETLPASPDSQARDFTLEPAAHLSGVVTDARGTPVPGAQVTVAPVLEENGEGSWQGRQRQSRQAAQSRTDAEGRFVLEEVNPGPSLQASIRHREFKSFTSEPFTVSPGARVESLKFQLQAGGRIEVTLRDSSGSPLADARVRLQPVTRSDARGEAAAGPGGGTNAPPGGPRGRGGFDRRPMNRGASRTSNAAGVALFTGMVGGDYTLSLSRSGYQPVQRSLAVIEDQTATLPLVLLNENVITGVVQDRAGAPVASASLRAWKELPDDLGTESSSASSDAMGSFRLGSLGAGPYGVRVSREGFVSRTLEAVEVNSQLPVVLDRLGGIAGFVRAAETGAPVTTFQIRLRSGSERSRSFEAGGGPFPGGRGPGMGGFGGDRGPGGPAGFGGDRGFRGRGGFGGERRTFNDSSGAFEWTGLSPGAYTLEVTAQDHAGTEVRVQVEEGAVTQGIEVALVEGLSVRGTAVLKGTAVPVPGAQVFLLPIEEKGDEERDRGTSEERRLARNEARENRRAERRSGEGGASAEDKAMAQLIGTVMKAAQRGGSALATTDESGGFQLREVPLGRYLVVVSHDAYVPARVEVTLGQERIARAVWAELEEGEQLEGTVTLADGSTAAGAMISVRNADGIQKQAHSDGAGRYVVQGLLPGKYTFSVRTASGGNLNRSAPVEVAVEKGSNRYDHQFTSNP